MIRSPGWSRYEWGRCPWLSPHPSRQCEDTRVAHRRRTRALVTTCPCWLAPWGRASSLRGYEKYVSAVYKHRRAPPPVPCDSSPHGPRRRPRDKDLGTLTSRETGSSSSPRLLKTGTRSARHCRPKERRRAGSHPARRLGGAPDQMSSGLQGHCLREGDGL